LLSSLVTQWHVGGKTYGRVLSGSVPRVRLVRRLYFTARPMEDGLAEAIDEGKIGPRDDPKTRGKILADEYGWDKDLAKKIWCAAVALSVPQHHSRIARPALPCCMRNTKP
jgi:hypothetical protein